MQSGTLPVFLFHNFRPALLPRQITPYRMNSAITRFIDRLKALHFRNRKRGVYGYMWWTGVKIALIYAAVMIPVVLIGKYLINVSAVFSFFTRHLSDPFVFILFFISESFLGMIPPDLFVIWSAKFNSPFFLLTILGVLSYAGGIVSYYIGRWLSGQKRIRAYSERVLDKYIKTVRKWGGAFIIIAAIFPFSPFSMVVIAVSLMKYPFKLYLLFGLSRIIRFIGQGVIYLGILNLDSILG